MVKSAASKFQPPKSDHAIVVNVDLHGICKVANGISSAKTVWPLVSNAQTTCGSMLATRFAHGANRSNALLAHVPHSIRWFRSQIPAISSTAAGSTASPSTRAPVTWSSIQILINVIIHSVLAAKVTKTWNKLVHHPMAGIQFTWPMPSAAQLSTFVKVVDQFVMNALKACTSTQSSAFATFQRMPVAKFKR